MSVEELPSIRCLAQLFQWGRDKVHSFLKEIELKGYMESDKNRTANRTKIGQQTSCVSVDYDTCVGQKSDSKSDKNRTDEKETSLTERERSKGKDITLKENNNTPLSTNVDIPPTDFEKFNTWLKNNAPRVLEMKEPFTPSQFVRAKEEYGVSLMQELLEEMHNWEPLIKNNRSAYLTFRTWAKRKVALKEKVNHNEQRTAYRLDSTYGRSGNRITDI
ncbi:MAG: hypothetical protein J6J22_07070 [Alistipes sp.]|nr:hypothetical protein [Alistipes sp.]MBP3644395.1 hypothetical protein [Alistipes sp.]